ncbi:HAD family hydrolase [Clostridium botulinum]|uniref:HAD-superfamily hydrolase, subfamily IA, variant 1 n=1 Tax=Clostridium botulinum (strain 657 / Type Ba4) TaxID=515621 RepID=A0A3F3A514_CLOB6|nr:HAD-superfamily hydrolase, subfamily IA, variant 1 [Clostridium botulinum Ba4 str. 657]AJD27127.1 HAD hydrolase, IA, variant 1 family protein [Clostridium botulinum CDC_297]AJE11535.1 HAD hydrolase, IA, variant 1 family protein [Clostridium botulinum CDC_1436]APR00809.1 HAD hydrolase, IA, variant 1 family protein [Clostridium botulinum]EPS52540.1 HAD superfamily hydrolase [Clostridium botulinum A1 str. CFSAN002368]
MINTIIFDLDDTLYKELDFVYGAFKEVCTYLSNKYNKDEKQLYKDILNTLEEHGRGKIFNIICEKYNMKADIKELVKIYREAKPKISLYEDAKYILTYLKAKNVGIITDGKASVQWNKIKLLGLEKMVDKIIVTDDFGLDFWKPHEFAYREMLKYFNCTSEQCIYVGDNPHKDFIGARKVGMHTVRIIREVGDHMNTFLDANYEADNKINSLREMANFLN